MAGAHLHGAAAGVEERCGSGGGVELVGVFPCGQSDKGLQESGRLSRIPDTTVPVLVIGISEVGDQEPSPEPVGTRFMMISEATGRAGV